MPGRRKGIRGKIISFLLGGKGTKTDDNRKKEIGNGRREGEEERKRGGGSGSYNKQILAAGVKIKSLALIAIFISFLPKPFKTV